MNETALPAFLSQNVLAIAWGVLLIASLPVIFRLGLHRLESRSRATLLGALILILTVAPLAAYTLDLLPHGRSGDSAAEVRTLREKLAILDLDNVRQNDLAIAYQRENADLGRMVTRLRAQAQELEGRLADLDAGNKTLEERNTAYREENGRLKKKVADLERRSSAPRKAASASTGAQEAQRTARDRSAFTISIATPKRNQSTRRIVEAELQRQGYQVQATLPFEVSEDRLVFYDASDEGEAERIAAVLKRNHGIQVTPKLSPNRNRVNSFQLFLKP